jgi:hypothetical protein
MTVPVSGLHGHFESVPLEWSRLKCFKLRSLVPDPVFPDGSREEISAVASRRRFWIVKVGFKVGVYATFDGGAAEAVGKAIEGYVMSVRVGYKAAVDLFQEAVRAREVKVIPYQVVID